jgi:hypothetical protein
LHHYEKEFKKDTGQKLWQKPENYSSGNQLLSSARDVPTRPMPAYYSKAKGCKYGFGRNKFIDMSIMGAALFLVILIPM